MSLWNTQLHRLQIISQGIIGQYRVVTDAEEVQIYGGIDESHQGLEVLVEPIAHITCNCAP